MTTRPDSRHLVVIVILGLCLLGMLGASLWHRVTNPSLTISHFRPASKGNPTPADSAMTAIGQLMEAVAKDPHDMQALLRLTESLMAVGQWQSAENFAQKALAEPGENGRAMYLLAVIHHNKGQHKEAAELLEKLLEKENNPSARYSLAILYIHFLNQPEAGRRQLLQGLAADSASPGLVQAMQEELGKLPPESQDSSVAPSAQTPREE